MNFFPFIFIPIPIMASIIEMPKLSDTMTTGTLAKWLKKEGDTVASGDMIATVETDKATMELECFEDGVILKQYAAEGDEVAVGAPVCAVGEKGEAAPASDSAPAAVTAAAPAPVTESPAPTAAPAEAPAATPAGRVKASPLAKKVASAKGIDISTVHGTGPGGRVVRDDVDKAAAAPAPGTVSAAPGADTIIKVNNMRATIARRLLEAKTTIPHFYLETEVDVGPLLVLRGKLNDALANEGVKLTVNDFILKASIEALRRVPSANSSWLGDKIVQYGAVHIAFAVAVEEGLLTPTIKDADRKSLRQISADAKVLATKARDRKLTPAEMSGSTFTISNLGMFGITNFFGIINPPNGAILCVGTTVKKPVVNDKDQIVVGQRMSLGLSCDHRVVDGAVGAKFLAALKLLIEAPELMLA